MPGTPGPRTGLAPINPTGESPTLLRASVNDVIAWLEANAALTSSGLLASRPTSTPGTPGIEGRKYYATDVGLEFRDTGTGWVPIGIPIGGTFGWITTSDLTPEIVLGDGRILTSASYPVLDALIGAAAPAGRTHLWNGGSSPGAGLFRLPDYRGKTRVAPDNMGTARGAANLIPNSNRAAGQSGGEERHTLTIGEMPAHSHGPDPGRDSFVTRSGGGTSTLQRVSGGNSNFNDTGSIANAGGDGAHNIMQPYAVENVLVRIT